MHLLWVAKLKPISIYMCIQFVVTIRFQSGLQPTYSLLKESLHIEKNKIKETSKNALISNSVAKLKFWNGTKLWLKKYFFALNGTFVKKKNTHICMYIIGHYNPSIRIMI